jgi:hypothetical protein
MAPRTVYATLADGQQPFSLWDQSLADMGNIAVLPCTAAGVNAVVLTQTASSFSPTIIAYQQGQTFSFAAAGNSTGSVTIQVGTLAAVKLYKTDGITQAASGDLVSGVQYFISFNTTLNSNAGGFQIIAPTGGGGTVISGAAGQLAYYASTGPSVSGNANFTVNSGTLTLGQIGSVVGNLAFANGTSGTETIQAAAGALGSGIATLQAGTYNIVGTNTTDTLTNKTFDTAGAGNSFKINGTAITAINGSGAVSLTTSPTFVTPLLGTPTSGTLTNCTGLPPSGLTNQAAWTFLFNNTSGSAPPTANTIDGLTLKASPAGGDELILWDVAGSAIKKATVTSVAAGSTVSSIAGNTGAFTLAGGVTNSTNQIQLDGNYTGFAVPNCTLAASVASNILTVALKDNAGSDPSATSPVYINYRNATAATGTTALVTQTAALSITTNATGASLGSSNNTAFRFWVVIFNNAGTNVLALINCSTATTIFPLNEGLVASSTPMSASATSAGVFYTPNRTTITSKAFRILGYVEYNSTGLATAGTYATGPNFIQTFGPGIRKPGEAIQVASATTSSATTNATNAFVSTNSTVNITPTSAANLIHITASGPMAASTTTQNGAASIFNGSTQLGNIAGASVGGTNGNLTVAMEAFQIPNSLTQQTYLVKIGTVGTSTTFTYPVSITINSVVYGTAIIKAEEIMS